MNNGLRRALLPFVFLAMLLAGCAQPPRTALVNDPANKAWAGRLSLQVDSEPPQSFSAGFELRGQPERGDLTLISPLGNVLGVVRWAPDQAELDQGNGSPQRYESLDALMTQVTGAAVPVSALFAWLQGDNAQFAGWSADLSRQPDGRITAKRTQPAPAADLRVVLDR